MNGYLNYGIDRFCVVGVSYQKADTAIRSRFSLQENAACGLIEEALNRKLDSVLVLSTCNRVEVYGFTPCIEVLVEILLAHCPDADKKLLHEFGYRYQGKNALEHLFRVGAGLESQILGDYEIVGQLKQSISRSLRYKALGSLMNRMLCHVLRASKKIKNQTALSKGTASVSFAAVEWLKEQTNLQGASILIIGAGSLGKRVVKNLKHYCPDAALWISNRTPEKAIEICRKNQTGYVDFNSLARELPRYDVVFCCTNAPGPFIDKSFFEAGKKQWIVDLSVPANVRQDVRDVPGKKVVNVDVISAVVSGTMNLRLGEVQKANRILQCQIAGFMDWLETRRHISALTGFRQNLLSMSGRGFFRVLKDSNPDFSSDPSWEKTINNSMLQLMNRIRKNRNKGCQMILAYDNFIASHLVSAVHA